MDLKLFLQNPLSGQLLPSHLLQLTRRPIQFENVKFKNVSFLYVKFENVSFLYVKFESFKFKNVNAKCISLNMLSTINKFSN